MTLKLYFDLMSQPSRALYILLKNVKCDFTPVPVDLRKAEHYSEEYTKINRFQRVPVIDHDGFVLTESVAILKYLSREGIIPDNLYPKDSKQAARVEEFLEWQHAGLRLHCAMFFRVKALDPIITGKTPDLKTLQGYERRMESALDTFNDLWLGQGKPFVAGDRISVADLLAACEVEQPRMAGYDANAKYSNIADWMRRVREYFNPHYDEGHVILNKIVRNKSKMAPKL
ncbi:glutathione S-transferase theta-1-like [Cydia fagiglandana]|uniref:glutathione S-transferase theta-1-like n=1 Tax=Cydia fagiglandana TaxID=1458189 RepID=UPI002FEE4DDF